MAKQAPAVEETVNAPEAAPAVEAPKAPAQKVVKTPNGNGRIDN